MDLKSLAIDRRAAQGRRQLRRGPWPLRLLAIAVVGTCLWLFWPGLSTAVDRLRLPLVRTIVVEAAPAAASAAVTGTAANGYVVAARRAALSSDVPGRIVELNVVEGSVVRRGDIVARLFADEYRAALQRAEAEVEMANAQVTRAQVAIATATAEANQTERTAQALLAQVAEAEAQRRWASSERLRVQDLVQSGISSTRDIDRAVADLDAAEARVRALTSSHQAALGAMATARARVQLADSDLVVARANAAAAAAGAALARATVDKTDVRAPFDGIVVLKDAEIGEVVSPNVQGGSTARGAVCTLVDFESLEVQANVPETSLKSVQLGAPADIFLDAFPDQRYGGIVDRIWPTADRQKATIEVRIRFQQPDRRLRPEMGVRVVFQPAQPAAEASAAGDRDAVPATTRPVIVLPIEALVEQGGRTGAFAIERDTVRFCAVQAGERRGDRVAITGGLRPGQRIVLAPPSTLQDGDRVRLQAN